MFLNKFEQNSRKRLLEIIRILQIATQNMDPPAITQIVSEYGKDPYLILISCLLSLRAKDSASLPVSRLLFNSALTPYEMINISQRELEKILYSIGFYRNKARQVLSVSHELIDRFEGKVPATEQKLLSIKGIGPKTANIVLSEAFGIPAIAVDIHVHRIANRLGLVNTKSPEQTEKELKKIVPHKYWSQINPLLVMWGQNICEPISPWCSKCAISKLCPRINVKRSR